VMPAVSVCLFHDARLKFALLVQRVFDLALA
jgi:hypothetical protein